MEIKMTDEQLRSLLVESLFEKISPEERKNMLTAALTALMEPQPSDDRYSTRKRPSRLQNATEDALMKVAVEVIAAEMVKDDVREQIRALTVQAIHKVFVTDQEATIRRMALALSDAISRSQ